MSVFCRALRIDEDENGIDGDTMPNIRGTITLRDYQQEACDKVLAALKAKKKRTLVHMATGGGKSITLGSIVKKLIADKKGTAKSPIVILSINWDILCQIKKELQRLGIPLSSIGRIGGENEKLKKLPSHNQKTSVLLTTLHTFHARRSNRKLPKKISYIFHDEAHYGDNNTMVEALKKWMSRRNTLHVGFTATPKSVDNSIFPSPIFSVDFPFLVEKNHLARPIAYRVLTHQNWSPQVVRRGFDFSPASLGELNTTSRNRCIVAHYIKFRARYGATLVYAINQKHAEKLTEAFANHKIPCGIIHDGRGSNENAEYLQRFREGRIDVLVNVNMLTVGIDIPRIRSIFLCRPTSSEILYMQMVGRGARLFQGQKSFNVVDFVDSLATHKDKLFLSDHTFFSSRSHPRRAGYVPPPRITQHFFAPKSAPIRLGAHEGIPENLHRLWFQESQSFGVELELTHHNFRPTAAWKRRYFAPVAKKLLKALRNVLGEDRVADRPVGYHQGTHDVWNVEYDSSTGWEVITPILSGVEGVLELCKALKVLNIVQKNEGLLLNADTGTHIHLGWNAKTPQIKNLIHLQSIFEPALACLVAPSRIAQFDGYTYDCKKPNIYCRPISSYISSRTLENIRTFPQLKSKYDKYCTLNIQGLKKLGTVEFRMHSGTLSLQKILLWLSLQQQLLHAVLLPSFHLSQAQKRWKKTKSITPNQHLLHLAKKFLPDGQEPYLQNLLKKRQQEIRDRWSCSRELQPWLTQSTPLYS